MLNKTLKFIKNHIIDIIMISLATSVVIIAVITSNTLYDEEDKSNLIIPSESITTTSTNISKTKATTNTTRKQTTTTTTFIAKFPIDVNKVTFEELIQINNIGEVTANNIITFRKQIGKITNMEQLINVNGIGENTLNVLKEHLYVSDEDYMEITTTQTTCITTIPTVSSTTTTQVPVRHPVNINIASAEEISECLLLEMELAQKIVELRDMIHVFVNPREVLLVEEISMKMYEEFKEYIII